MSGASNGSPGSHLEQITTHWATVTDPVQFVMRYAPAIRNYLKALIDNADDAEEAAQEFLVQMLQQRFAKVHTDQGRFRFYLKQAVRNAAHSFYRLQRRLPATEKFLDDVADREDPATADADQQWTSAWRQCILDRAWTALESHQRQAPGNLFYAVLRARSADVSADSASLARLVSQSAGRPVSVAAFDKQVSRARRMFAELVLREVCETLEQPTPQQAEVELIELGLYEYVRDVLPADWRQRPELLGRQ